MNDDKKRSAVKSSKPTSGSVARRGDADRTSDGRQKVLFKGYVNLTLTEEDKRGFAAFVQDGDRYEAIIADVLARGYKLSVSFDAYHECYSGNLYCQEAQDDNAGYCLAIKAGNPFDALARVVYVHHVVFSGKWVNEPSRPAYNPDQWT